MQQKFKIGDKVKVLTKVYGCDIHGKIGTITKLGGGTYIVERNMQDYDQEEWGCVEEDSWRYAFHEDELELVEDKPKTKFKAGDKVVCVDATCSGGWIEVGKEYTVTDTYRDVVTLDNLGAWLEHRFELVTDQEVSNTEPDYVVGQEVYVSNDFNRYLRKGVLLDASPRTGLMHVNIGGFDCFVEEERVYTKEMKGD